MMDFFCENIYRFLYLTAFIFMTKTIRHTPLLAFGEVIMGYANYLVQYNP